MSFSRAVPSSHFGLYAVAALGGAVIGTVIGLRWVGETATRYTLAGILLAAGIQLFFFEGECDDVVHRLGEAGGELL